jgi:zona occludens toxin (predicted ATPase)
MITQVTGTPGAGKSIYALIKYILPELERKASRKIITNIPLNIDALVVVYGDIVRDSIEIFDGSYSEIDVYEDSNKQFLQGVLFIVDECQEHYDKDKIDGTEVMAYFSRHRKYACDFVIITQNPALISRKLRALVEYCHYLSKTRSIGGNGYIVKTYAGQSSRSKPIMQSEGEYKPEYYGFYRSYSQEGLKEISTIKAKFFTKIIVFIYKNLLYLVISIVLFVFVVFYQHMTRSKSKAPVSNDLSQKSTLESDRKRATLEHLPSDIKGNYPGISGYEFQPLSISIVGSSVISCRMKRYSLLPKSSNFEVSRSDKSDDKEQPLYDYSYYKKVSCTYGGAKILFYDNHRYVVLLPDGRIVE